jgi:putative OPT family oligopeptide transporter
MASVAKGVFQGGLPWAYLFVGMAVAVVVISLDQFLQARKYPFRTPVLAVAIGFYLPFQLSVPICVGGIISFVVKTYHKKRNSETHEVEASDRKGVLMASGLITGEALMGIIVAIPIVILKGVGIEMPLWEGKVPLGGVIGVILLAGMSFWLYQTTVRNRRS